MFATDVVIVISSVVALCLLLINAFDFSVDGIAPALVDPAEGHLAQQPWGESSRV